MKSQPDKTLVTLVLIVALPLVFLGGFYGNTWTSLVILLPLFVFAFWPRFSLRRLLGVVTLVCILLAILASIEQWKTNANREVEQWRKNAQRELERDRDRAKELGISLREYIEAKKRGNNPR